MVSRPRIGMVTIGQSPRTDVVPEIVEMIGNNVDIIEAGALDNLTREEIEKLLKPEVGEIIYVTRMRDGSEIKISKEKLMPFVETRINDLEKKNVDLIAMLCSGEFPQFKSSVPIIYPDKVLKGIASSIYYKGKVAILIPAEEQIVYAKDKWSSYFEDLRIFSISPYTSSTSDFEKLGFSLRESGVNLVIMDCIGYSKSQRETLKKSSGISRIITSRRALARVLIELI